MSNLDFLWKKTKNHRKNIITKLNLVIGGDIGDSSTQLLGAGHGSRLQKN